MWKSFDDLNAAHTRFHTEIQSRIGNESFDGSEEIYEEIRALQSANLLAVRKEKWDCARREKRGQVQFLTVNLNLLVLPAHQHCRNSRL